MDFDDIRSDPEQSPEHHQNDILDDFEDDIGDLPTRERSQTPVYNNEKSKPRKRLVKKGAKESGSAPSLVDEREDVDDEEDNIIGDDFEREMEERKRKKWGKDGKEKKRLKVEKKLGSGAKGSGSKSGKTGNIKDSDKMLNEMWNAVAPSGDSEVCVYVFGWYVVLLIL